MMIKVHSGIRVGDFIKAHGHRTNEGPWRKVIRINGDTLVTVNRHGYRGVFTCTPGVMGTVWPPGDPQLYGDAPAVWRGLLAISA